MPTRNATGRSRRRHNGWPLPAEIGAVYTLHYARALGDVSDPRGHARHYTGWAHETCLAGRLAAHWDGTCRARLPMAFHAAGIPFAVVAIERGVTRARENQLKLSGAASRCPVCRGQAAARRATLLTEQAQTRQEMIIMQVHYSHRQEWELRITPEDGETWPREKGPGGEFQPTVIVLTARTGWRVGVSLRGKLIRADGKVGVRTGSTHVLPAWAAEKLAAEREARGLTDGYFRDQGAVQPVVTPAERMR